MRSKCHFSPEKNRRKISWCDAIYAPREKIPSQKQARRSMSKGVDEIVMSKYTTAANEARASALKLLEEREGIDEEIELQSQVLRAQNVSMQSPLIDSEGFPLAQPDLLAVRSARARIIALENDRRATEDRMRSLLEQALARGPNVSSKSSIAAQSAVDKQGAVEFVEEVVRHPKSFAAVDSVAIGGPASNAVSDVARSSKRNICGD